MHTLRKPGGPQVKNPQMRRFQQDLFSVWNTTPFCACLHEENINTGPSTRAAGWESQGRSSMHVILLLIKTVMHFNSAPVKQRQTSRSMLRVPLFKSVLIQVRPRTLLTMQLMKPSPRLKHCL